MTKEQLGIWRRCRNKASFADEACGTMPEGPFVTKGTRTWQKKRLEDKDWTEVLPLRDNL
jgi:hypothetical protein